MENLFEFSPFIIAIVPIVLGLVEVAKQAGLPKKFTPCASLVIGVGLVALTGVGWQAILIQGTIAGLAASGLWSSSKTIVKE